MCAPDICDCPADEDVVSVWGAIPEEELRKFGRIANAGQYTPEEFQEITLKGPYDASVIIFNYVATDAKRTYKQCYEEGLKPKFDAEKEKPEGQKDEQLATTMAMVETFFDKGGFELLADLEEKYECASICSAPLFYLSKDVKVGPPTKDCLTAALDDIGSQMGPAIVCALAGILLLISVAGGLILCSKTEGEKDMMNQDNA